MCGAKFKHLNVYLPLRSIPLEHLYVISHHSDGWLNIWVSGGHSGPVVATPAGPTKGTRFWPIQGPELDALSMYDVWGKSTLGHWAGAMALTYCTAAEWVLCSITSSFSHF